MSLETSLDQIIQDKPSDVPSEVAELTSKPVLRVKNIHNELTEDDLKDLFGQIAEVEQFKFDSNNRNVGYIWFVDNNDQNNHAAIAKFDGRKAMGKLLIVQDPRGLKDRIQARRAPNGPRGDRRERGSRGGNRHGNRDGVRKPRELRKEKKTKKSVEDLDAELTAYMEGK